MAPNRQIRTQQVKRRFIKIFENVSMDYLYLFVPQVFVICHSLRNAARPNELKHLTVIVLQYIDTRFRFPRAIGRVKALRIVSQCGCESDFFVDGPAQITAQGLNKIRLTKAAHRQVTFGWRREGVSRNFGCAFNPQIGQHAPVELLFQWRIDWSAQISLLGCNQNSKPCSKCCTAA